jgi:plastocyanin
MPSDAATTVRPRRRRRVGLYLGLGTVVLLGAAVAAAQEPQMFEIVVAKDSYKFNPSSLIIEVGDAVKWVNADVRRHLMSSVPGTGSSDELEIFCPEFFPEKTCDHTFNVPGRYPYFCFIHRQMVGEVIVLER